MMEECLRPDELAGASALAASDPRRRHLDHCPRCRARAALYRSFVDPGPAPENADLPAARRRLRLALEHEMAGDTARDAVDATLEAGDTGRAAESARAPRGLAEGVGGRWWRGFASALRPVFRPALRPIVRPALGLAVIAVIAVAVVRLASPPFSPDRPVFRGQEAAPASVPQLLEPSRDTQKGLTLRWSPAAGADSYEVILFGTDLRQRARFPAGAETTLRLRAEQLSPIDSPDHSLIWVVVVLHGGDEIGRSAPGVLRTH